jgi:hypothetical protein
MIWQSCISIFERVIGLACLESRVLPRRAYGNMIICDLINIAIGVWLYIYSDMR